ncbi:MAG: type II secretion system protein [Cytophagales bacterium]
MARLKIKSATLVEIVIAMLILSISLSAAAITFSNYFSIMNINQQEKSILQKVQKEIEKDTDFPKNLNKYEAQNIDISYRSFRNKDSVLLVKLSYFDSATQILTQKYFVYVKD